MSAIQPDRQRQVGSQVTACPVGRDLHADLLDLSEQCFDLAAGAPPRIQDMLRRMGRQMVREAGQEGRQQ